MDNQELKIKFEEIDAQIADAKAKNFDAKDLLKMKYNLLKVGYARIRREVSTPQFDKNPKKYSTLLSYLKTMRETAQEAGIPCGEVDILEEGVKEEMTKNNLAWLLN